MAYAFDIPERPSKEDNENAEEGDDLVSDDGDDEKTILSMIPLADMLVSRSWRGSLFGAIGRWPLWPGRSPRTTMDNEN